MLETRPPLVPVWPFQRGAGTASLGPGRPATGFHWLVIRGRPEHGEQTVRQMVEEPAFALQQAQQCGRPVELWRDDDHLCTIAPSAGAGSMWVITPGPEHAKQREREPAASLPAVDAGPRFEAVFCHVEGLQETAIGSAVTLSAHSLGAAEAQIGRLRPPAGANCVRLECSGAVVLRWLYAQPEQAPPAPGARGRTCPMLLGG